VKKVVKVCARTNELIGFEDLQIPKTISESIAFNDQLPEAQIEAQAHETDSGSESSSEDSSDSANEEQKTTLVETYGKNNPSILLVFFGRRLHLASGQLPIPQNKCKDIVSLCLEHSQCSE